MKTCLLCLFPRSEADAVCHICGRQEWREGPERIPPDFALRMASERRFGVAYASLEHEVACGRATAGDCLRLAWLGYAIGDYRAVETWCHECERLESGSAEPHVLLGYVFERGERWPEAVEEYDVALRRGRLEGERRALVESRRAHCEAQIPEW